MNKMWVYRFPEICKKLYNAYIEDSNLKYGNILAKLEFILDSVRIVDEDDLILWKKTEKKVPLSELKWEEFVEEEDIIPSEPKIDLPITISVADMVQNPFDEVSIIYSNTTRKLNIDMNKKYICTFVGKDGNNYVYNDPITPKKITLEDVTYVEIGAFDSYHFTPQLVSPMTQLDTMWVNNGVSFDKDGNPVINGFYVDMSAGDGGQSHTDDLVASIDSVIISEYTQPTEGL